MNLHPVIFGPGEDPDVTPDSGIALCLGGGGFRSMLFHLGVIVRLNECGWLRKITLYSSVSGGSITAAMLGFKWRHLHFDESGVAGNLLREVAQPLMTFARGTIDLPAFVVGVLPFTSPARELAAAYSSRLFGDATLQSLPDEATAPRFLLQATSLQTCALWQFSRDSMGDETVGLIPSPQLKLATAVAASSAYPPLLSPLKLKLHEDDFDPATAGANYAPPYTRLAVLSDGGIQDKLAMATAWKACRTVLVSDASATTATKSDLSSDWVTMSLRIATITENRTAALHKRQLMLALQTGLRQGAYWGIRSDIRNYELDDALICPLPETRQLADIPSRYAALSQATINRLVNWGYAICDAAMRKHVDPKIAHPAKVPFQQAGAAYHHIAPKRSASNSGA